MSERTPPTIDHDETEFADKRAGWPSTWLCIGLVWAGYLYFNRPDWWALAVGAGTGLILAAWAIDVTGGKVPKSWRSKPPSADR